MVLDAKPRWLALGEQEHHGVTGRPARVEPGGRTPGSLTGATGLRGHDDVPVRADATHERQRTLEFAGSRGASLAARLDLPEREPRAYALFAHCFTCTKDTVASTSIARALTESGIAVLGLDLTGLGGSGGDLGDTDFSSNVEDVVRAADHLRDHFAPPSLLIGHSLGGAAVLAAAHRVPEARAVATIGAPADPEHVRRLLGERIATLGAALLVLHSPSDDVVGVDNARRIFETARDPKSFIALDGADHLLSNGADARFVADVLAAWAVRYLVDQPRQPAPREPDDLAVEGTVVVSESDDAPPFGQRITAGRHSITADEPQPVGADSGPGPYDLLLASLGACTSMTVRMYAQRKQWPLERVTVRLRHSRIHASDCVDCETRVGRVDRIERTIQLDGDLQDDQRRRLLEIADKCPVHRTLHSEIKIDTTQELR